MGTCRLLHWELGLGAGSICSAGMVAPARAVTPPASPPSKTSVVIAFRGSQELLFSDAVNRECFAGA